MFRKLTPFMLLFTLIFSILSCKKDVLPKPSSQLRLEYPLAQYAHFENTCHFTFDINSEAVIKEKSACNFTIDYPKMKATIYLSYKPVNNNINVLLRDAHLGVTPRIDLSRLIRSSRASSVRLSLGFPLLECSRSTLRIIGSNWNVHWLTHWVRAVSGRVTTSGRSGRKRTRHSRLGGEFRD